ncbi:MAG: hypothetical protein AAFV19_22740 [Pseudomonadota bacterium]
MVHLRTFFQAVVLSVSMLCVTGYAAAESVDLTPAEIQTLLTGNTAVGTWQGQPYRQYFREDGDTIYAPKGQRSTLGKWRIGATFETWWESDGWTSWGVARDGHRLTWTGNGITPQAFEMVPGPQLLWPE